MNDTVKAATEVAIAPEQQHPALYAPGTMPTALALYLDTALYERVKSVAVLMSKAGGVTPKHLVGAGEACFAIVSRAITWRLDPFAVAMATFQTPGGQIGFEGKLVHAIIENSGRLEPGGIRYEHYGDWSKVQGKFAIRESQKKDDNGNPRKYTAATWTDEDARAGKPAGDAAQKYPFAQSCGVRVSAHVRGEREPRHLDFDLIQAQPRNSTLWATDPMTQICYTAIRRFGSVVASSLLMGVPFDPQDNAPQTPSEVDVTPQKGEAIDKLNAEVRTGKKSATAAVDATPVEPAKEPEKKLEPAPRSSGDLLEPAPHQTGGRVLSYAEVVDKINAAKDADAYNVAVDMIRHVKDPEQRKELMDIASMKKDSLEAAAKGNF